MSQFCPALVLLCALAGCTANLKPQLDAINQQCKAEIDTDPPLAPLQGHVPLTGLPTAAMYADVGVVDADQAKAVAVWDAHNRHCDDLKLELADKSAGYLTALLSEHEQNDTFLRSLLVSKRVTFGSFNSQIVAERDSFLASISEIDKERQQRRLAALATFNQTMQQINEQQQANIRAQQQAIQATRPVVTNCMSSSMGYSVSTSCTSN